jgi:NADH-quinone oxidoreductase subunit L
MRLFSGLKKALPTTHWTFLCGCLALAGFPLLSGFWSKDEILATTYGAWHDGHGLSAGVYCLLFFSGLFTAGLTAFYTFRAYFKTFHGVEKFPDGVEHPHEAPPVMAWPLRILAVGAVGVGFVLAVPPLHLFQSFLETTWIEPQFKNLMPTEAHHMNLTLMLVSSAIALAGIGIAYWMYVKQPSLADDVADRLATGFHLSRNKFYFDELYELFIVRPMNTFAHVCRIVDTYLLDGLVDLLGQTPVFLGYLVRPVQNGLVQFYALLMALGLAGFALSVLLR